MSRTLIARYASLACALMLTGCFSHRLDGPVATRYHEDGRAKPIAIIPSMLDTTSFDVPWSIGEELTSQVVHSIATSGEIFIKNGEEFAIVENPFSTDLSWMKSEFVNQHFVVFLELVEHELVPSAKSRNSVEPTGNYLNMGVRVRVIDLRGTNPKIVLQELVRDSYYIPKSFFPTDYQLISWGCEEYAKTPMGIAHTRIAQEISSRITDYILLAQSR